MYLQKKKKIAQIRKKNYHEIALANSVSMVKKSYYEIALANSVFIVKTVACNSTRKKYVH